MPCRINVGSRAVRRLEEHDAMCAGRRSGRRRLIKGDLGDLG